jgi:hypothetical protein
LTKQKRVETGSPKKPGIILWNNRKYIEIILELNYRRKDSLINIKIENAIMTRAMEAFYQGTL